MTTEFQANLVSFGDQSGLGAWEVGHYRQHLNYNDVLAARSPAVVLPVFPIFNLLGLSKFEIIFWLNFHEKWHELVRPYANVTNIDLSEFDITKPSVWYEWQDLHNAEHAAIDKAFGIG